MRVGLTVFVFLAVTGCRSALQIRQEKEAECESWANYLPPGCEEVLAAKAKRAAEESAAKERAARASLERSAELDALSRTNPYGACVQRAKDAHSVCKASSGRSCKEFFDVAVVSCGSTHQPGTQRSVAESP